jgi:hypothetical protein
MNKPALVDSSVLLDIATVDPTWGEWSMAAVLRCGYESDLVINPIVFAEVSADYDSYAEVDIAFPTDIYRRVPMPYEAAYLAAKAHLDYRRRGGTRTTPLPDFFIGAHAQVAGYRLLTRDPARFRT